MRWMVLLLALGLALGCSQDKNFGTDLQQPPTTGIPTKGPGSGQALGQQLYYALQKTNPKIKFSEPDCPDVTSTTTGSTLRCTIRSDDETLRLQLIMSKEGTWQMADAPKSYSGSERLNTPEPTRDSSPE